MGLIDLIGLLLCLTHKLNLLFSVCFGYYVFS